ncbi:MAG: carotenoid oxygenase family protein [Myxococcales bacterium]|nr:carotenoid oxygenase family protein [Myxococcales bacterium]MCB9753933.1 carotenoid oxygenase family protein [Myxococcales bacterium]
MTERSRAYEDLPREHPFEPLRVEGELPPGLEGTLFRAGPATSGRFGLRYSHAFEGDGAVCATKLAGGAAFGAVRMVQSDGYREETEAGRLLYGFSAPWWRRMLNLARGKQKNTANTAALVWNDRLFALMEGATPVELERETLETIGETTLGNVVGRTFSAHPHVVGDRLINFGSRYGKQPGVDLYAWPKDSACRHLGFAPLPDNRMIHDFAVTERHAVFFASPVSIQLLRAILNIGPFERLVRWRPELGTEVVVVPLAAPERARRFTTEPFFQWHFINAFEDGEELVVDACVYPNFDSMGAIGVDGVELALPEYARCRINAARTSLRRETIGDAPVEFPSVLAEDEGRRSTDAFCLSMDHGRRALIRVDPERGVVDRFDYPEGAGPSEPIYVPSGPGGAGHLLTLVHDADSHTSALHVFDAQRLEGGPVARAHYDHHIPFTFHGRWAAA